MRDERNAYKTLAGNPEGKRPLRFEANIKMEFRKSDGILSGIGQSSVGGSCETR
jgi:hypothetical protein